MIKVDLPLLRGYSVQAKEGLFLSVDPVVLLGGWSASRKVSQPPTGRQSSQLAINRLTLIDSGMEVSAGFVKTSAFFSWVFPPVPVHFVTLSS